MIKNFIGSSVRSNPLVKQIGTVFSGGAIGQVVTILTAPIITRLFTPEDFGVFALFFSIASMVGNNSQLAYYQGLVIPPDDDSAKDLLFLCLILTLLVSFISAGATFLVHQFCIETEWIARLDRWLFWVPVAVFLIGTNLSLGSYNNRHKKYLTIAGANISLNSVPPLLRIIAGTLYGSSVAILVFSQLIALVSQAIILCRTVIVNFYVSFTQLFSLRWLKPLKDYKDFPLYSLPSSLLASLAAQLPIVILSAATAPEFVGFYAVANRLVARPLLPLQDAVRQVYQRRVAEQINDGSNSRNEFLKITFVLFLVGLIPFGIIAFWGKEFFGLLLGSQWEETGRVAAVLVPWLYTSFILPPTNAILLIGRFNRFRLCYMSISTFLRILTLYYGLFYFDNSIFALFVFSALSACFNLLLIIIVTLLLSTQMRTHSCKTL